ncbi:MAG: hypothetical protein RI571_01860 [Roseovarius sp.]|nr:hypothetical protein [Roseovarius sp.]
MTRPNFGTCPSNEQEVSVQMRLRAQARRYDWRDDPEADLGDIVARKCLDLETALAVFFNGRPERFNYLRKHEVPAGAQGAARVLDNICLRANSGFYLATGGDAEIRRCPRLAAWLNQQEKDRRDGRSGRYILDARMIAFLAAQPAGADAPAHDSVPDGAPSWPRKGMRAGMRAGVGRHSAAALRDRMLALLPSRG